MIARYAIADITKLWGLTNKLRWWWKVERLVCEAWHEVGLINNADWTIIAQQAIKINLKQFTAYEQQTRHETVAFLMMVLTQFQHPAKKWIHYGLTASDVIDTTQNLLIVQSLALVKAKVDDLQATLLATARQYKQTPIMGRTHGVFAEPTSLGLKFLNWYAEIARWQQLLTTTQQNVAVVNLSGSVGNYAHLHPQIQVIVAKKLGLRPDWSSTQVTQRDRYIPVFATLAGLTNSFAKIATEFRHWQKSEVGEVMEAFNADHQTGSSSMPHKQNPVSAENICGLTRILVSNLRIFYDNNLLWNERDISHSSNERIVMPQCFHLIIYLTQRLTTLIKNMRVLTSNIETNLVRSQNRFYSQLVMNYLIKTHQWSRGQAYALVKRCSYRSWSKQQDFLSILKPALTAHQIPLQPLMQLCQVNFYLKHVDLMFKQVLKS